MDWRFQVARDEGSALGLQPGEPAAEFEGVVAGQKLSARGRFTMFRHPTGILYRGLERQKKSMDERGHGCFRPSGFVLLGWCSGGPVSGWADGRCPSASVNVFWGWAGSCTCSGSGSGDQSMLQGEARGEEVLPGTRWCAGPRPWVGICGSRDTPGPRRAGLCQRTGRPARLPWVWT
jgi:hypothetical protein